MLFFDMFARLFEENSEFIRSIVILHKNFSKYKSYAFLSLNIQITSLFSKKDANGINGDKGEELILDESINEATKQMPL